MDIETEVLPHVDTSGDCWFWCRGHNGHGRPYFKNKLVYRLLYEHFIGAIPSGLVLDHEVCDNPKCVNPSHLVPKTQRKNLERANVRNNLGIYLGNPAYGHHLGDHLGRKGRERDARGRFVGG
jgi:hypothetical protein